MMHKPANEQPAHLAGRRKKTAWVLINVGSPASPAVRHVRRYLRQFLSDRYVIDVPPVLRWILVNLIIVPFRAPRSAGKYREIWTSGGSPLLSITESVVSALRKKAAGDADVFGVMRYGKPSLADWLDHEAGQYEKVTFLPLFPQYAAATARTVGELVRRKLHGREDAPAYTVIRQFWDDPAYLEAMKSLLKSYTPNRFDHVVFSYHGLPLRQLQKIHPDVPVSACTCDKEMPDHRNFCYRAACFATTRQLTRIAGINPEKVTTAFQSRLSKRWMSPFTDQVLAGLAAEKENSVLVIPASFVTDNLETLEELRMEYRGLYLAAGGRSYTVAGCLDDSPAWISALYRMLQGVE